MKSLATKRIQTPKPPHSENGEKGIAQASDGASGPTVRSGPGTEGIVGVEVEHGKEPRHVHVTLADLSREPSQHGTVFLGIALGTVVWGGGEGFTELDGCIHPAQLDTLIHCLALARDEAVKIGLLGAS